MQPLNCPTCSKHCLSVKRKLLLSPASTAPCVSWGARVSLPWLRSLLFILLAGVVPSFVGVIAVSTIGNFSSKGAEVGTFVVIAAVVAVPFLWAYYRFVPLVVRGA